MWAEASGEEAMPWLESNWKESMCHTRELGLLPTEGFRQESTIIEFVFASMILASFCRVICAGECWWEGEQSGCPGTIAGERE